MCRISELDTIFTCSIGALAAEAALIARYKAEAEKEADEFVKNAHKNMHRKDIVMTLKPPFIWRQTDWSGPQRHRMSWGFQSLSSTKESDLSKKVRRRRSKSVYVVRVVQKSFFGFHTNYRMSHVSVMKLFVELMNNCIFIDFHINIRISL